MRCADLRKSSILPAGGSFRRGRGVALIEVLVALTLLGGLVSAGLTVKARLTRTAAVDARRTAAVAGADALLTRWWALDDVPWHPRLPRTGSGDVPGTAGLRWTTRWRALELAPSGLVAPTSSDTGRRPGPRVDQVRLDVWPTQPMGASDRGPLYTVELLLPVRPAQTARPVRRPSQEGGGDEG